MFPIICVISVQSASSFFSRASFFKPGNWVLCIDSRNSAVVHFLIFPVQQILVKIVIFPINEKSCHEGNKRQNCSSLTLGQGSLVTQRVNSLGG